MNFSDEYLNAFVDDQLDAEEKGRAFESIERDDALKARVCDLRGLKEKVKLAYPPLPESRKRKFDFGYAQAIAACLLLLTGCALGWIIAESTGHGGQMTGFMQAINRSDIGKEPSNIIIQVSDSNPVRLKTALDETESLLESYRRDRRMLQVEIIANGGGIDLLSGTSPYAGRVASIKAKYGNIDFLVCNQTLLKLKKRGVQVRLLPHTGIASSAADEINRRLNQGWDYVRV